MSNIQNLKNIQNIKQLRINWIKQILGDKYPNDFDIFKNSELENTTSFAPSNIALVKYWGKKDLILNQPTNDSVSISLKHLGARTSIKLLNNNNNNYHDKIILNNKTIDPKNKFCTRLSDFIDLFRNNNSNNKTYFEIDTKLNIPMGCGVASSACGFAAITKALDKLFQWNLSKQDLSKIAQIGSGSAARSLWDGFVHWQRDGDAYPLTELNWPDLNIGLGIVTDKLKKIGSTEAMLRTQKTAPEYDKWPEYAQSLIQPIISSIKSKDFKAFGEISEECAIKMHELIHSCSPVINYDINKTIELKKLIHKLRSSGIPVYFTQDAGPNIKLLFQKQYAAQIQSFINNIIVI